MLIEIFSNSLIYCLGGVQVVPSSQSQDTIGLSSGLQFLLTCRPLYVSPSSQMHWSKFLLGSPQGFSGGVQVDPSTHWQLTGLLLLLQLSFTSSWPKKQIQFNFSKNLKKLVSRNSWNEIIMPAWICLTIFACAWINVVFVITRFGFASTRTSTASSSAASTTPLSGSLVQTQEHQCQTDDNFDVHNLR